MVRRACSSSTCLAAALALLLCAGCDSRDPPTSDEPKVTEEELVLSAKAQDCVTEHVRQHFSAAATDDDHARAAVLACEADILRFERIRGLETAAPGPDLSQLLAERSASSPSRDRLRAHRLRLECWRLGQKVAADLRAAGPASAAGR